MLTLSDVEPISGQRWLTADDNAARCSNYTFEFSKFTDCASRTYYCKLPGKLLSIVYYFMLIILYKREDKKLLAFIGNPCKKING